LDTYDPLDPPDPKAWLELDELDRIGHILDYHQRAGLVGLSPRGHAVMHAVVESHVALEDEALPVRETMERLMAEGLDRHEAIHAVGSVLGERLQDTLSVRGTSEQVTAEHARRLRALRADDWK
jgi:hypothetical protein